MSRKKTTFDTEKLKKIGDRIRGIRNATGLNQPPFAKMIGISQSSISDLENGKYPPSMPILLAIQNQYSVSPDQILTGEGFDLSKVKSSEQRPGVAEEGVEYVDSRGAPPRTKSGIKALLNNTSPRFFVATPAIPPHQGA
jgi:transcriptional regulator with XRE-family HTH domain